MSPFVTSELAREAAALSNRVRAARAAERRELRALPYHEACRRFAELLLDAPAWLASEPAHVALMYVPEIGSWRASKLLALAGVREVRTVSQLTMRQRKLLARALGGTA